MENEWTEQYWLITSEFLCTHSRDDRRFMFSWRLESTSQWTTRDETQFIIRNLNFNKNAFRWSSRPFWTLDICRLPRGSIFRDFAFYRRFKIIKIAFLALLARLNVWCGIDVINRVFRYARRIHSLKTSHGSALASRNHDNNNIKMHFLTWRFVGMHGEFPQWQRAHNENYSIFNIQHANPMRAMN